MNTIINIMLITTMAVFFSISVINNLTDFDNTMTFIQHTLSMDTTKQNPKFMWRAIESSTLQQSALILIITIQALVASLLWLSIIKLLMANGLALAISSALQLALFALAIGFVLYALGFITLAGQWFMMREATTWNVTLPSHIFMTMIGLVMLLLSKS